MSAARYLREVGQGYYISGVVDYEQVRELARINGVIVKSGVRHQAAFLSD